MFKLRPVCIADGAKQFVNLTGTPFLDNGDSDSNVWSPDLSEMTCPKHIDLEGGCQASWRIWFENIGE
jgi:hypothetical protein